MQRLLDVGAGEEFKALPEDMLETTAAAAEAAGEGGVGSRRQLNSPLLWAAYKGHLKCVWLLLNAQLSTTDVDTYGNTALHLAAAGGHTDCVTSLLHAGVDLHARNYHGNTAADLATQPDVSALLGKAMQQRTCAGTGDEFGPHDLRHLCHSTRKMYSDECISRIIPVHASAAHGDDTLMPVRFYTEIEYQVGDAESALEAAMQPAAEGGTDAGALPGADEESPEVEVIHAGGPLQGSGEPPSDFGLAAVVEELDEHAVPGLLAALDKARELRASVKLIAAGRQALARAHAWLDLKRAVVQVTAQRPLEGVAQAESLSTALSAAGAAGVGVAALGVARRALVAALNEIRLADAVAVGRAIPTATHGHDGDIAALAESLAAAKAMGVQPALAAEAATVHSRLTVEVQLTDEMQELQTLQAQYEQLAQELASDDAAAYPRFARLAPGSGAGDDGEGKEGEEVFGAGDTWPPGQEYDAALDPAGDAWLAAGYLSEEEEEAPRKKGARAPRGGKAPKKGAEEEAPKPMPQASPQMVHLRRWKRAIAGMTRTAQRAAEQGSAEALIERALAIAGQAAEQVDAARDTEVVRVTGMELERQKREKRRKKGKKKGKKK